jgi:hypothetical protein
VATRRWILFLLAVAMISGLAGCGGSSTNVQNQPAPPTSSVSITFQPAPAASLSQVSTMPITAVVSDDPTNAGVDWALLCQSAGNCGTLSPLHTASGKAATYTPPTTPTGNVQAVTIEAFATADHTKNAVATFNVTGFASMLKGAYVFAAKGQDAIGNNGSGGPYELVGVIVLDGNGNITSGEQTRNGSLVTASNPLGPILSVSDAISGGSYLIGPDGRGTLTINTADQNIGQQGIENLSLVVISSSQALISSLDNVNGNPPLLASDETSTGTLELQTTTAAPTGGYAFTVNGVDINSSAMAIGGILNIDSPASISGIGSVADLDDAGVLSANTTLSGTLTSPDSFGSLKFNLTAGFASNLQLTGYIVDARHIELIESDNSLGTGFGTTAGVAIGQGAARGGFTNKAFAGSYVFDILGQDPQSGGVSNTLASVGQFTADSSGNLTSGFDDEDLVVSDIEISDSFTGIYTLDSTGMGRVDSNLTFGSSGAGPELIFYLTGNGSPPLVLDADDNPSSSAVGAVGVGLAHPQAAPPFPFNGEYGVKYVETSSTGIPNSATGQITVNGTLGSFTGVVDTDANFNSGPNTPLTGTFGSIPSNGRVTGTLNNTFLPASNAGNIAVAFYLVNPTYGFFIETDSSSSFELSFAYFATRTPVCPSCP